MSHSHNWQLWNRLRRMGTNDNSRWPDCWEPVPPRERAHSQLTFWWDLPILGCNLRMSSTLQNWLQLFWRHAREIIWRSVIQLIWLCLLIPPIYRSTHSFRMQSRLPRVLWPHSFRVGRGGHTNLSIGNRGRDLLEPRSSGSTDRE